MCERPGCKMWCDDDVESRLTQFLRQRQTHRPVQGDDPTEGRNWIAGERRCKRRTDLRSRRQPAGNGVFDDRGGWLGRDRERAPGSVRIEQVVEGQIRAVVLLGVQDSCLSRTWTQLAIRGSLLV